MRRLEFAASRTLRLTLLAGVVCACSTSESPDRPAATPIAVAQAKTHVEKPRGDTRARRSTDGQSEPAPEQAEVKKRTRVSPPADGKPRVYAKTRFVWIREYPNTELQWIGFLWTGGSVRLKSEKVYYGPGCNEWYAIEPKGYVCVDGQRATLDANDPVLQALIPYSADLGSAWPHEYGESQGLQRFTRLPAASPETRAGTAVVQAAPPPAPAASAPALAVSPPGAIVLDHDPFRELTLPGPVHEGRPRLLPRSTVAYSSELVHQGHPYLLAADMTWVPKDAVTPYEHVSFQGVELGKGIALPLAFFRGQDRPKYRRTTDARFETTAESFARLSYVELTGKSERVGEDEFLETKLPGIFVKKSDAVLPTPRPKTPWGTSVGSNDRAGLPEGRATWMEASIWEGWLVAFEGNTPVYATLISPGRGGTPVPGKDPLVTASTPTGTFPITGKFATATMEAPGEFIHSDVPWTQNFSGPHALHGAYWHNDWGKLKSAGCVNVSPLDGRWLYGFTEPVVPEGWHGVRWLPKQGPATLFVIHG